MGVQDGEEVGVLPGPGRVPKRENCGGGVLRCLLACLHQQAGEQV